MLSKDALPLPLGAALHAVCLNDIMKFDGHISSKDEAVVAPPEHLPEQVEATSEKVLHA